MKDGHSKSERKIVLLGGWQQHVDLPRLSDRMESEVSAMEELDTGSGYLSVAPLISNSERLFFVSYGGWAAKALWVSRFPEISAVILLNPVYSMEMHSMFHMAETRVIIFYSTSMEMVRRDSQKIHDYTPNSEMVKVSCDDPGVRNLSCENVMSAIKRKIDELT
ncbi:MAG: hypothetical protein M1454_02840 [Candidatus Thermoplasmatota archaeon]|nr:hypothetical protein [Candidatus Thermoplasmatota archaeon]MCL5731406.1 hypothetical protein [Candidatus Thermoplasmatota archaeon]